MKKLSFRGEYINPVLRFIYYGSHRRKFLREMAIKSRQNELFRNKFDKDTENIIAFLVPGADINTGKDSVSGGVISIASLYAETEKLGKLHGCKLIMCTFPLEHLIFRHSTFESAIPIFRFNQLTTDLPNLKKLILHIPEFMVSYLNSNISIRQRNFLSNIPDLQINILNQNIRLMPGEGIIRSLRILTSNITVTTAHVKYCTEAYRKEFGVPLHFFSTFASPENYRFAEYREKENIVVLSPDDEEKNRELMQIFKDEFPDLKVIVIKNLKYEDYKSLIAKAKWSVTFGEGLDFYFIEPVFSGGISFALFNELFFTPDFKGLSTVYADYSSFKKEIVQQIRQLDNEQNYNDCQKLIFQLCAKYYSKEQYRKNIAAFYNGQYTYA